MQHEVTKKQRLLNDAGEVAEPGWARHPVWLYDRRDIRVSPVRIKEWDYYMAGDGCKAAAFTISDLGYIGMVSVSLIDLVGTSSLPVNGRDGFGAAVPKEHTETVLIPFPMGKMGLRAISTSGIAEFRNKRVHMRFASEPGRKRIRCVFKDFVKDRTLRADLRMQMPETESMCIATPWKEDPRAFYYNQKINCIPVHGTVELGSEVFRFSAKRSMAVMDWGRGVWTYDNTWYWGTCSTMLGGKPFGFNLGYGFSDRSSASENVLFYDGKVHKLSNVEFQIPEAGNGERIFMNPWTVTSDDGRFEAVFVPALDRRADIDMKLIRSDQHQVFGTLTGTALLDDGTEIKMRELPAAVEVIHNRY